MKQYTKMKDSQVEWIGDVPDGWRKIKLKHVLKQGKFGIKIGPFGSSLKLDFMVNSGYKVFGQENVIKSNFDLGRRFIDTAKFSEMKIYELLEGDIIVTMMGTIGLSKTIPTTHPKTLQYIRIHAK